MNLERGPVESDFAFRAEQEAMIPPEAERMLNYNQREAIRQRDGNRCRANWRHKCNQDEKSKWGGKSLNVHHIQPQMWEEDQGIPEEVRDRPNNLITVCTSAHDMIHPDNLEAKLAGNNSATWDKVQEKRREKTHRREPFWFTIWDSQMTGYAIKSTQEAQKGGWTYPPHNHRILTP